MNRGHIKIWRKIEDSGIMGNAEVCQLFLHLILKATWKQRKQVVGTSFIELRPGQAIVGRKQLALDLHSSERRIRTCLETLEKLGVIDQQTTNKYTVISFVNWDKYQNEDCASDQQNDQQDDQQATSRRPATDQQTTNRQHEKRPAERPAESLMYLSKNGDERPTDDQQTTNKNYEEKPVFSEKPEKATTNKNKEIRKQEEEEEESKKVSKGASRSANISSYDEMVSAYTRNQDLKKALGEFIVMRKAAKRPFTNAALEHTFRELDKLAGAEDAAKIAILNQSVQRGWQGVFPVKDARTSPPGRTGMSAQGNRGPDGQERDYGPSRIPAWGKEGAGT